MLSNRDNKEEKKYFYNSYKSLIHVFNIFIRIYIYNQKANYTFFPETLISIT